MNLSPKGRFQSDKERVADWQEVTGRTSFQVALEAALLHVQFELPRQPFNDTAACAASFHRLEGARHLATVLLNLAEKTALPSAPPSFNLTQS